MREILCSDLVVGDVFVLDGERFEVVWVYAATSPSATVPFPLLHFDVRALGKFPGIKKFSPSATFSVKVENGI